MSIFFFALKAHHFALVNTAQVLNKIGVNLFQMASIHRHIINVLLTNAIPIAITFIGVLKLFIGTNVSNKRRYIIGYHADPAFVLLQRFRVVMLRCNIGERAQRIAFGQCSDVAFNHQLLVDNLCTWPHRV